MGRYEDWITRLRLSWMGVKAQRIMGAFGYVIGDKALEYARQSTLESYPQYCSLESLALHALDRGIEHGPTELEIPLAFPISYGLGQESAAAFGLRLTEAMTQWQLGGTFLGLLIQLFYAEFDGAVIVQQNGLAFSLNAAPDLADPTACLTVTTLGPCPDVYGNQPLTAGDHAWWMFDDGLDPDGDQFCSRFEVLFPYPQNSSWTDIQAVPTSTSRPSDDDLARLRRVIAAWKPAKATCMGIRVFTAGAGWGWTPDLEWGDGTNWGEENDSQVVWSY